MLVQMAGNDGKEMFRGAGIGKANAVDGDVKLGIRPKHLVRENKGGLEQYLYLQIAKPLGVNTLLYGWVPDGDQPVTVSLAGVHSIEAGQGSTRFSVDPSHFYLFDPATGVRLQG